MDYNSRSNSKFDTIAKRFRHYYYKDGPLNEEYLMASCQDKAGTIYIGGVDGIDYFKPDELIDYPFSPNIVFTDFKIFN